MNPPQPLPESHPNASKLNQILQDQFRKIKKRGVEVVNENPELRNSVKTVIDDIMKGIVRMRQNVVDFENEIRPKFKSAHDIRCICHPEVKRKKNWNETLERSWRNDREFTIVYDKCEQCLVNEKNRMFIEMGVPEKTAHATFDNYEISNPGQEYVSRRFITFVSRGSGFIIACGTVGTGKTHLLSAALKWFGSGAMVTHASLVDQLRQTYDDGGKRKLIKKYRDVPFFVLDELDPKIKGDDIQPFLYEIIAFRYDRSKPVGIGSNEDIEGVIAILGEKIRDRIADSYTVANFNWESYRRRKK